MNVGIVTVYNSMNYGAFLQAYAMKTILEEKGHNVCFLKTNVRNPLKHTIAEAIYKLVLKRDLRAPKYVFKKYNNYKKYWKYFKVCNIDKDTINNLDCVVFGSDEIWNVTRQEINKFPVLFGYKIPVKNKIAFAPSLNNAQIEDFKKYPDYIESIKSFEGVAVRGTNSQKVMSEILGREVQLVPDPTLLIEDKFYRELEEEYNNEKYILLYAYASTIKEKYKDSIIKFAKDNGYKLVSVLSYLDWCDENPQLSVGELLSCYRKSDLVFTNTFHGTILSTIYKKEFVSLVADESNKVTELLTSLDLNSRILTKDKSIQDIISATIDYDRVGKCVCEERAVACSWLEHVLDSVKKGLAIDEK